MQIQLLVQSYFLQDMTSARIVGFKEVRWYQKSETRPTKKKPKTEHSATDLIKFIRWIHKHVIIGCLVNGVGMAHIEHSSSPKQRAAAILSRRYVPNLYVIFNLRNPEATSQSG